MGKFVTIQPLFSAYLPPVKFWFREFVERGAGVDHIGKGTRKRIHKRTRNE
jgi:hypothetical protein